MKSIASFTGERQEVIVPFNTLKVQRAIDWFSALSDEEGIACILWDADTDGCMSGNGMLRTLSYLYPKIRIINYMHRTKVHGINRKLIDFIKEYNVKLLICVDCGSSEYPYIKELTERGVKVLVVDHHLIEGEEDYESNPNVNLVNARQIKGYEEMSGAMTVLQFMCSLSDDEGLKELKEELMEGAILSIVADVCDTNGINQTFMSNYLYGHVKRNNAFMQIQNKIKHNRDYLISLSSKFNAYIRYYGPHEFMKLMCEGEEHLQNTDFMNIKSKDSIHIKFLMKEMKLYEFSEVVFAVFHQGEDFFHTHKVRNYLGIIANKLAKDKSKVAVVMMPSVYDYETDNTVGVFTYSARDFQNRNTVELFRSIGIKANGHPNAFGGQFERNFTFYFLPEMNEKIKQLKKEELDMIVETQDIISYIEENPETVNYMGVNNCILKERIVLKGHLRGYIKPARFWKEIKYGNYTFKTNEDISSLFEPLKVIPTFDGNTISYMVERV